MPAPLRYPRLRSIRAQVSSLLLQPHTGRRPIRAHEGTVVAPASNQRWAPDGLEIPCWNGEVVRVAFAINDVCEAFVKTLKRDYARVNPRPDAISVLQQIPVWFEDYNTVHPHSGLRMRSPREFIALQSANQVACPV